MELEKLKSELIRSTLFGTSLKRRAPQILVTLIKQSFPAEAETAIKDAETQVEQVKALGAEAEKLALNGIDADSLEYENLMVRARQIGDFAQQYCVNCFQNPEEPEKPEEPQAQEEQKEPEKPQDPQAQEEQKEPEKPEEPEEAPLDLSGLAAAMMSNSIPDAATSAETLAALQQIQDFRTWQNDFDKKRELNELLDKLKRTDPERFAEAKKILADGKKISELIWQAFSCGTRGRADEFSKLKAQARALGATSRELNKLQKQFEKGKTKAIEYRNAPKRELPRPEPEYDPDGAIPFFPANLRPSSHWTVMVDETGNLFDESGVDENKKESGKLAAVLIPEGSDLPKLGAFHATDSDTGTFIKVLDTLLHTKIPCGILGVTLEGMAKVPINYWYNGLERLFALIFRLLPSNGQKTEFDIYVEARGTSDLPMVQRCIDCALYHFAQAFPERSRLISLKVNHIEKKENTDPVFDAYNGYVDTVACAWGGNRKELKELLNNYGLIYNCLLEGETQEFYQVLDNLAQNNPVTPEQWSSLVNSNDRNRPDSLTNGVLKTIGRQIQNNLELWQTYLNFVLKHLDSKAIRLHVLGNQINFLKKYQPLETTLPPRLQLLWLTAKLAEANHRGAVAIESYERFRELIAQLYEEDAPLSCWATLHLAVSFTNGYEFEKANQVVSDFLKLISSTSWNKQLPDLLHSVFEWLLDSLKIEPCSPAAIPGLQYYAQLISSHGQHEAFMDNNDAAVPCFVEAIRLFKKLSNPRDAFLDIAQTSAYLLTSLMDQTAPDATLLQETLDSYFGKDLNQAAEMLAQTDEAVEKYRHHILLRLILTGKAPVEVKEHYLSKKAQWKYLDDGHPWEMIAFYRALLLDSAEERKQLLRKAYNYCAGADATLHVISAVILGTLLLDDPSVEAEYKALVERCIAEVPALEKRGEILRQQVSRKLPPLELAKLVLPFNFR